MTLDNLMEELTRLEKTATPGPWEGRGYGHISAHVPQSYEAEGFTITTSLTPLLRLPEGVAAGNWKNDADLIVSLRNHLPTILSALKENQRLREALTFVLPLAKGYAHEHPVGANQRHVDDAIAVLAALQPQKVK